MESPGSKARESRSPRAGAGRRGIVAAAAIAAVAIAAACSKPPPERSPETVAIEERAGDFLDYYEEVLRAAQRHGTEPDSFLAAIDSLPGSHLSDEEWEAWTAPYRGEPVRLADRLEEVMAELSQPR